MGIAESRAFDTYDIMLARQSTRKPVLSSPQSHLSDMHVNLRRVLEFSSPYNRKHHWAAAITGNWNSGLHLLLRPEQTGEPVDPARDARTSRKPGSGIRAIDRSDSRYAGTAGRLGRSGAIVSG